MKPQTRKLLDYLRQPGATITRDNAYHKLGIQNLTARLSELSETGYTINKTAIKTLVSNTGLPMTISAWSIQTFREGDYVKVDSDTSIFSTTKDHVYRIIAIYWESGELLLSGNGMRKVKMNCVSPYPVHAKGSKVRLVPTIFEVSHFDTCNLYYVLRSKDGSSFPVSANFIQEQGQKQGQEQGLNAHV